jgi:hypothetical protein
MDGCLTEDLAAISLLSPQRAFYVLQSEGPKFELTRSLLNVLYNLVKVQSLEPSPSQRKALETHEAIVWPLLSPRISLQKKKALFEENISLAIAVAESCRRGPPRQHV